MRGPVNLVGIFQEFQLKSGTSTCAFYWAAHRASQNELVRLALMIIENNLNTVSLKR